MVGISPTPRRWGGRECPVGHGRGVGVVLVRVVSALLYDKGHSFGVAGLSSRHSAHTALLSWARKSGQEPRALEKC